MTRPPPWRRRRSGSARLRATLLWSGREGSPPAGWQASSCPSPVRPPTAGGVRPRRRSRGRVPCHELSTNVGEIGLGRSRARPDRRMRDCRPRGLPPQCGDDLGQCRCRAYPVTRHERRFAERARRHDDSLGIDRGDQRCHTRHRTHRPVESKFAHESRAFDEIRRQGARGDEQSQCNGKIEAGAGFPDTGWRQIDRHPSRWPRQVARQQRGADTIA